MANESSLPKFMSQALEKLQEQLWFQQLRVKWDELDPVAKLYTKLGTAAGCILLVFIFVISSIFQVRSLKSELANKMQLRMVIQSATEELRALRVKSGGAFAGSEASGGWQQALKSAAGNAGIEDSSLEFGPDKAGEKKETSVETLVELKTKKISIKQLIRYAVQLETGQTPVKVRNLSVAAEDPEGYMDATLALSVFETKTK